MKKTSTKKTSKSKSKPREAGRIRTPDPFKPLPLKGLPHDERQFDAEGFKR